MVSEDKYLKFFKIQREATEFMSLLVIHRNTIYILSVEQRLSGSDDVRNIKCGEAEEESRREWQWFIYLH